MNINEQVMYQTLEILKLAIEEMKTMDKITYDELNILIALIDKTQFAAQEHDKLNS